MAAPTLTEIMAGIDARLATVPGLRHSAYTADTVNPPHAVVGVPDIASYRDTMRRGKVVLAFPVTIFVSAAFDRIGQATLAEFASWTGANSIALAIEADRTLGGAVDDCIVTSFRVFGLEEVGALNYYGGEFTLQVAANGV